MTRPGREHTEHSGERLAPVSYLPWATPGDLGDPGDPGVPEDPARTLLAAENILTRRLRGRSLSVGEARVMVAETDLDADAVEALIARFVEIGYLDDERLAEQVIHTHHERKGLGRSAVEAEMRRRRIEESVVASVLAELEVDESGPATVLASARLGRMSTLDDDTAERRLVGFLLRKGYSGSVARDAVRAAFVEAGRRAR